MNTTPNTRASDGRPDDPFNGQCPVDDVATKYRNAAVPAEDRIERDYLEGRSQTEPDFTGGCPAGREMDIEITPYGKGYLDGMGPYRAYGQAADQLIEDLLVIACERDFVPDDAFRARVNEWRDLSKSSRAMLEGNATDE